MSDNNATPYQTQYPPTHNKSKLTIKTLKQLCNLKSLLVIALIISLSTGSLLMLTNNNIAIAEEEEIVPVVINATTWNVVLVDTPLDPVYDKQGGLMQALAYAVANPTELVDIYITGSVSPTVRFTVTSNVYLYIEPSGVLSVNGGSRGIDNYGSIFLNGGTINYNPNGQNVRNYPGSVIIYYSGTILGNDALLTGATGINRDFAWLVTLTGNGGYIDIPSLWAVGELRVTVAVPKSPVNLPLILPVDFVVYHPDGYVFDGWYTSSEVGGVEWEIGVTPVVEDVILYARWSGSYLVTYDLAGGSGSALVDSNSPYSVGAVVYVLSGVPVRLGYGFDGWVASYDGGLYVGGDSFVMPAEDVVLVAVWSPVSYVVDYELDGGVLVGGVANPLVYTVEDSFPVSIPYSPFKVGYVFDGWTVSYVDGTSELRVPTLVYGIPAGT
ncbi:MAG: InlB B-repeat-containing protein, partial [Candidatus Bathyarchaeota archaeon]|nr:InlB B-repeat-containing protein [Candidatus Termiticorpusculum sp.]